MGDTDLSNILDPGTARSTRGVPQPRLHSTPGKHNKGSGEVNDLASLDGSPVIKVELSALVSPVSDSSTSPGEGDYTPFNEDDLPQGEVQQVAGRVSTQAAAVPAHNKELASYDPAFDAVRENLVDLEYQIGLF